MVTLPKIIVIWAAALAVTALTSVWIGGENKAKWFRKRSKFSFFLKRGALGEIVHFGYPCTVEGYLVSAGMLAAIAAASYVILVFT